MSARALAASIERFPLQEQYDALMTTRKGDPAEETLARLIASWIQGEGVMPQWLGLGEENFRALMKEHFPDYNAEPLADLGQPLDPERRDEMADLHKLLMQNRTSGTQLESWMADIVTAGCMGADHLWQDLGLWQRPDLSRLMRDHFEPLALRNDRDMKWKKFLYKQLCDAEGIYTCRAPSCEVCADYANCFGPEE